LYTHGRNGEYGHNRHKEVHRAVKEMLAGKELCTGKVFFFSYRQAHDGFYCVPNERGASAGARGASTAASSARTPRGARVVTRLSAQIARAKRLLISSAYEFSSESFEARSASAVECFEARSE